ncbi:unnamed protein product [marine sediment metagenome]|uniref:Uncharacterized protein n=1 Tax=marine sediment metagenome TaxID=412755 RepID=X0ZT35_9ZZZZ
MQNKPNFPDAQMNVNKVLTRDYENIANSKLCENKPNTKPIQSQFAGYSNERIFFLNKGI